MSGFRQCFAWWSFTHGREVAAPALLEAAASLGYRGVEMLPRDLHTIARANGLTLVTESAHRIEPGFNDPAHHHALQREVSAAIARAAEDGVNALIVFSGNRGGSDRAAAVAACAEGLAPLAERAAAAGVTLLLEVLNSKVDHPGYDADSSAYAFEVTRRVDHPSLRVLFDAYHVQVMEGNLLATLVANLDLVGHVHTAGVPGRRDLDDRQEINWRGIANTLNYRGYDGWLGHEFIPRGDPVAALAHAYALFAPEDDG